LANIFLAYERQATRNLSDCSTDKWKRKVAHQWFLQHPVTPVGGVITLDDRPGLGMELDESKIEEQRTLSWTETRWS
jgi:L-alanine-DL-glutamate epimerase-like enolase superfamily enzyme